MNLKLRDNSPVVLVKAGTDEDEMIVTNFAVITFTKELIERISKLRKAREEAGCYEVTDFDYSCDFISEFEFAYERDEDAISAEEAEALETFTEDNKGVWQVEPIGEGVAMVNADGVVMHVSEWGVKFTAYVKHTSINIWTERVPFDAIDKMEF